MPDGPRPNGPRYDDDFYAWTQYQAEVLRSMRTRDNRFDREHVAEEIEDLGKSERSAVRSEVRRILEHFLKLAYSPAAEPRSDGMVSIASARAELEDKLTATLRKDIQAELPGLYTRAKKIAILALVSYDEANAAVGFPGTCPFTLEQILADDWYPEPPGDPA
jgi:hypothetical protein